jgi:hypothetical protein
VVHLNDGGTGLHALREAAEGVDSGDERVRARPAPLLAGEAGRQALGRPQGGLEDDRITHTHHVRARGDRRKVHEAAIVGLRRVAAAEQQAEQD